jgi:hypothetical protein
MGTQETPTIHSHSLSALPREIRNRGENNSYCEGAVAEIHAHGLEKRELERALGNIKMRWIEQLVSVILGSPSALQMGSCF